MSDEPDPIKAALNAGRPLDERVACLVLAASRAYRRAVHRHASTFAGIPIDEVRQVVAASGFHLCTLADPWMESTHRLTLTGAFHSNVETDGHCAGDCCTWFVCRTCGTRWLEQNQE